jgi:hypothetical protein
MPAGGGSVRCGRALGRLKMCAAAVMSQPGRGPVAAAAGRSWACHRRLSAWPSATGHGSAAALFGRREGVGVVARLERHRFGPFPRARITSRETGYACPRARPGDPGPQVSTCGLEAGAAGRVTSCSGRSVSRGHPSIPPGWGRRRPAEQQIRHAFGAAAAVERVVVGSRASGLGRSPRLKIRLAPGHFRSTRGYRRHSTRGPSSAPSPGDPDRAGGNGFPVGVPAARAISAAG